MAWAPNRGGLVWIQFSPQSGREQGGLRPAVIISPALYNRKMGLALMCPITSRVKGFQFEVILPPGLPISGVILVDHVKSFDWEARKCEFIGRLPKDVMLEVIGKLSTLIL
jgi:mRNA interferase MazF